MKEKQCRKNIYINRVPKEQKQNNGRELTFKIIILQNFLGVEEDLNHAHLKGSLVSQEN